MALFIGKVITEIGVKPIANDFLPRILKMTGSFLIHELPVVDMIQKNGPVSVKRINSNKPNDIAFLIPLTVYRRGHRV